MKHVSSLQKLAFPHILAIGSKYGSDSDSALSLNPKNTYFESRKSRLFVHLEEVIKLAQIH